MAARRSCTVNRRHRSWILPCVRAPSRHGLDNNSSGIWTYAASLCDLPQGPLFHCHILAPGACFWLSDSACTGWFSVAEAAVDTFASGCSWSWQAVKTHVQSFETDSIYSGVLMWACWTIMMLQGCFSSPTHETSGHYMLAIRTSWCRRVVTAQS